MATNLSSLLSDAFTIYSEAYAKIGRMGLKVAELENKPAQPRLWNELVYATRLYRVIEPSIILNDAGDAIVGVVGDVSLINNLLLKLKRSTKIFTENVFPTPLTEFVFNLGGDGGADADASYITAELEGTVANSRKAAAGTGISLTDNGPQGTFVINNTSALSSLQFDATVNPVLNFANFIERLFYGSVAITGTRTWSLSNSSNAKRLQAAFTISGLTPGASTHDQTLWANTTIYTTRGITPSAGVFRPLDNGDYEIIATTYDGINWKVNIY